MSLESCFRSAEGGKFEVFGEKIDFWRGKEVFREGL